MVSVKAICGSFGWPWDLKKQVLTKKNRAVHHPLAMGLKSRRGFVFGRNVNLLDPFRGSKRSETRDFLWLVSQIGRDF